MTCAWYGTIEEFQQIEPIELLTILTRHIYDQSVEEAKSNPGSLPQLKAWWNCIQDLKDQLFLTPNLNGYLIFEYEFPRSNGRRPDVLLLLPGELIVLEFKGYDAIKDPELHQISLYVRDFQEYHSAVHEHQLHVRGALVYSTNDPSLTMQADLLYKVYEIPKHTLHNLINGVNKLVTAQSIAPETLLEGHFQPLPSILESARAIFKRDDLPEIRNVKSSNFDAVIKAATSIIEEAERTKTHHMILVSGVPGAGKTFIGLTLAHQLQHAVYLSGNGPLVDVLQNILKKDEEIHSQQAFVQALSSYKRDIQNGTKLNDHILIFDEAQRAWEFQNHSKDSDPDLMVRAAKAKDWSVIVGLIGEGQEIHTKEQKGIPLWNRAIANQGFTVHARHNENMFPNAIAFEENPDLHLKASIRTHNALDYFKWVETFLAGDFVEAKKIATNLRSERFILKKMDSLDKAKQYVTDLYGHTDKTYGIVASSKLDSDMNWKKKKNERYSTKPHVEYYNNKNSSFYCKTLNYAASEFDCQGLELDAAIVYWDDDLTVQNEQWHYNPKKLNNQADRKEEMKTNAYRVLLTRGRDCVIVVDEHGYLNF